MIRIRAGKEKEVMRFNILGRSREVREKGVLESSQRDKRVEVMGRLRNRGLRERERDRD